MINKLQGTKHSKLIIGGCIVIATIAVIYGYFKYSELYTSTDYAYVGANLINVAPKVSGYLSKVYVTNNQVVKKRRCPVSHKSNRLSTSLSTGTTKLSKCS